MNTEQLICDNAPIDNPTATEPRLSTTLQATGLTEGTGQTPTKKLSTPTLTEVSSQLTTLLETGLTGGTSQTPTKKLSTPTLTEVSSQMTTLQVTGSQVNSLDFTPSDDEDFNIIVLEADVHHPKPNFTFKTSRLTDCLKTSSALNCNPPLNSKNISRGPNSR
ncbi:hypothetical protein J6590_031736 [Homalodisca vitripennis]|nr:hypothetical protein J6590_031736 [Homalodisca vitripennis]